jgi:hypothetical protein
MWIGCNLVQPSQKKGNILYSNSLVFRATPKKQNSYNPNSTPNTRRMYLYLNSVPPSTAFEPWLPVTPAHPNGYHKVHDMNRFAHFCSGFYTGVTALPHCCHYCYLLHVVQLLSLLLWPLATTTLVSSYLWPALNELNLHLVLSYARFSLPIQQFGARESWLSIS